MIFLFKKPKTYGQKEVEEDLSSDISSGKESDQEPTPKPKGLQIKLPNTSV